MDLALVASTHTKNIDQLLLNTKAQHDLGTSYLAELHAKGCRLDEIAKKDMMVISYDDWADWVQSHVDDIMGGQPESKSAQSFKENMIRSLKSMRIGKGSMKQAGLVELSYTDEEEQFIFAYAVVCCNDTKKKEMHVMVSGFGKKWMSPQGAPLDSAIWEARTPAIMGYLNHGALMQLKQQLPELDPMARYMNVKVKFAPRVRHAGQYLHIGGVSDDLRVWPEDNHEGSIWKIQPAAFRGQTIPGAYFITPWFRHSGMHLAAGGAPDDIRVWPLGEDWRALAWTFSQMSDDMATFNIRNATRHQNMDLVIGGRSDDVRCYSPVPVDDGAGWMIELV